MAVIMTDDWKAYEHHLYAGYLNSFECDELIAPVICILNKKGYTTEHCCSGHLFNEVEEIIHMKGDVTDEELKEWFPGLMEYYPLTDGCRRLVVSNISNVDTYICFVKGTKEFSSLPEGFSQKIDNDGRLSLSCDITGIYDLDKYNDLMENHPYDFFEKRLAVMKNLYNWAKELPDCEV
ncbi:MAG: hypothetical protein J6M24_06260 [Lachnospiraceae bacterium]|nr:hypothetical protein [Lachnospiraceae bacterium]